ncbi:Transcription initiation factor TFIID subunit 5 [Quillaja saponaria]|uniref:Transcription initiation factor TFIID subunit 5 n=1 Tax=Quillaja saponaria TaxID=32244 RepID=A0AAD7LXQ6_QUISA|nr:Transcription initiation factor TFIID subunit 5 [Quillaja saponaria]
MDDDQVLGFVHAYMKKKGFTQTGQAFQGELQHSRLESDPARYHDGYSRLRSWTYNSLDLYKHELLRVLYPVFIHCFMDQVAKGYIQEARNFFTSFREDHEIMHLRDLQQLEGVLSPSYLEEMEFAHSLRQSKVNINISQYSYELLMEYLHKTQSTTILGVINEHINFQV